MKDANSRQPSNIRWLLELVRPVRVLISFGLLLFTVKVLMNLVTIGMQKWVIDDILIAGQYHLSLLYLTLFFGSIVIFHTTNTIAARLLDKSGFLLNRALTEKFMTQLHVWPTANLQKERTGKLIHHVTDDIYQVGSIVPGFSQIGINHGFSFLVLIGFIGWTSPLILLAVIVVSVVYIALARYFGPKVKAAAKEKKERHSDVIVGIEEAVASTREVIAFHRMEWEERKFDRTFRSYFKSSMKEVDLDNKQLIAIEPLRWLVTFVTLGIGGWFVIRGSMTIGTLVILYPFAVQLMYSANNSLNFIMLLSARSADIDRLRRALDQEQWKEGDRSLEGNIHSLTLREVGFRYAEGLPRVLNGATLDFPIGRKTALVGASGGGKSTVAQLLIRFVEPEDGVIEVNGTPLCSIRRSDWNTRVRIVFQEPYLFPDTIRNNLLLGREGITAAELSEVCEIAQIRSFIEELPEGYDTEIGERGITLSGGQRQRLAIARALIGHPDILILDEATSALDLETERRLQAAMDTSRQGRTTIVIAHRLSTVRNADRIYVIQDGIIAEAGTHDELLAARGPYRTLCDKEMRLA
ncbi:ABC transporter ATP-binding protein [Paenibacillus sp. strain BS8-2]